MATPSIDGIESMLAQMRAVVASASALPAAPSAARSTSPSFATELARSMSRVSELQNAASAQARAYQMGDPNVPLSDVMIDLQKASLAFQTSVQVRNRLIAAYQEIASMPV